MPIVRELVGLRRRGEKHFATEVIGEYVAEFGEELHYELPDGSWDDLANLVQPVANGWAAAQKDVRWGVENGYLTVTYKGRSLTMRPTKVVMVDRTAPASRYRVLANASYSNITRDGHTIVVHDVFPNTDLTVSITPEQMSKEFTVRQRPNLPDPVALGWNPATTFVVFVWDVTVPNGASVVDAVTGLPVSAPYVGKNDLLVKDGQGDTVVTFAKGTSRSSAGYENPVNYVVTSNIPFGEAVSYQRMMVSTYPLYVDPTMYTTTLRYDTANWGTVSGVWSAGTFTSGAAGNPVLFSCSVNATYYDDGKGNSGWNDWWDRGLFKFDLSVLAGRTITGAKLFGTSIGSADATIVRLDSDYGTPTAGDGTAAGTTIGTGAWGASAYREISLDHSPLTTGVNAFRAQMANETYVQGASGSYYMQYPTIRVEYTGTPVGVVAWPHGGTPFYEFGNTDHNYSIPVQYRSGPAGRVLVLHALIVSGNATGLMAWEVPAGWTEIAHASFGSPNAKTSSVLCYRITDGTESATPYDFQAFGAASRTQIDCCLFDGVDVDALLDATAVIESGTSDDYSWPTSVTTAHDGSMIIAAPASASTTTPTDKDPVADDISMTMLGIDRELAPLFGKVIATAGTTNITFSGQSLNNHTSILTALKALTYVTPAAGMPLVRRMKFMWAG